jgi:hypothetical protein
VWTGVASWSGTHSGATLNEAGRCPTGFRAGASVRRASAAARGPVDGTSTSRHRRRYTGSTYEILVARDAVNSRVTEPRSRDRVTLAWPPPGRTDAPGVHAERESKALDGSRTSERPWSSVGHRGRRLVWSGLIHRRTRTTAALVAMLAIGFACLAILRRRATGTNIDVAITIAIQASGSGSRFICIDGQGNGSRGSQIDLPSLPGLGLRSYPTSDLRVSYETDSSR